MQGCGGGSGGESNGATPETATLSFAISQGNTNQVFFETYAPLEDVLAYIRNYLPVLKQLVESLPGTSLNTTVGLACGNGGASELTYFSSVTPLLPGDRILEESQNCVDGVQSFDGTLDISVENSTFMGGNTFAGRAEFSNYTFTYLPGITLTLNGALMFDFDLDTFDLRVSTDDGEWLTFNYDSTGFDYSGSFQIESLHRTASRLQITSNVFSQELGAAFSVNTTPSLTIRDGEYPESGEITIASDIGTIEIAANDGVNALVPGSPPSPNYFLYINGELQFEVLPDDGDPLTPSLGLVTNDWHNVSTGFLIELPEVP